MQFCYFWKSELLFNQAYCQYLWGARHRRAPPPGGSENPRIRFRPGMSFPSIFRHYWSAAGPENRRLRLHRPQSETCISNPLLEPPTVPAVTRIHMVWLTLTRPCFGDFPLPDEATNRRGEPPRPGDGTVQESDVQTATLRPPFHPSEPHWLVHNKP